MDASLIMDILGWVVPALLGCALGRASEELKALKREKAAEDESEKAIMEGVRSLLRCELIRTHRTHVQRGEPIDLSTREFVQKTYESYRALGGNGTGTLLYQEILDIPITDRQA